MPRSCDSVPAVKIKVTLAVARIEPHARAALRSDHFAHFNGLHLVSRFNINRSEDTARDWKRVRHKNKLTRPISDGAQFLFYLRHMLVCERFIGVERIHTLRVMRVRRGLCARP